MLRTTILATTLAVTFASAEAATPLQVKVYNADGNSFNVNSTLVYGEKEAMVIDAGFTRADALRIAANVLDSGKQLKTILVSQADPDYYFGVEALSANAPRTPVLPKALNGNSLTVDGQVVELRGNQGLLAHRPYFWIPSIKAIVGNIGVFGNLHVWTADTQTVAERSAWIAQLDEMAALQPKIVVPGHMKSGTAVDISAITYTKAYLLSFEKNAAATKTSAELIDAMKKAYPDAPPGLSLDIGAKVNKGEMKW
ncbi:MAG: MBL fold metallo-hydrolase [Burkholderiales bacterium]|nr:MBL fold metallo-hydrolase [Burkholderiales bacterium]